MEAVPESYEETAVCQGKSEDTNNRCAGLVEKKVLKHLEGDEHFNPFIEKKDRRDAVTLHESHHIISSNLLPIVKGELPPKDYRETIAYPVKILIQDNNYQNEPGFKRTNGLEERRIVLKSIQHQTEQDKKTRAVIMFQETEFDKVQNHSMNHATFFGTQFKNGRVSCSGMDSNFFVNYGEHGAGCDKVISRLNEVHKYYTQTEKKDIIYTVAMK